VRGHYEGNVVAMPFDLDCCDRDYRLDPERPKRREHVAENSHESVGGGGPIDAPVRLVGPEREAFLSDDKR